MKSCRVLLSSFLLILLLSLPASAQVIQRLSRSDTEVYRELVAAQTAVDEDPEDVEALLALGRADMALIEQSIQKLMLDPSAGALLLMACLHESEEAYNAVLEQDPENLEAQLGLAQLSLAGDDFEEIRTAFEAALALAPENTDVLAGFCEAYITKSDSVAEAVPYQERIVAVDPQNTKGLALGIVLPTLLGDEPRALENLETALLAADSPDSAYEIAVTAGAYLFLTISESADGETVVRPTLDSFGSLVGIYGDKESTAYVASQCFEAALERRPDDFFSHFIKGFSYLLLQRDEEGIALIKEAIALNPDNPYVYFVLGIAEALEKNHDEALGYLQQAVRMVPKSALANQMILLINAMQMIPEEQILSEDPEDQRANMMAIMLAQTDYMNALKTAVDENPNDPVAHINLGQALLFAGKSDEARKEYRAALRIDPNNAEANRGLAAIHVAKANELLLSPFSRARDVEDARDELEKALELDPDSLVLQATLLKFEAVVEAKDAFMDKMMRAYLEAMDEVFGRGEDDGKDEF